MLKRTYADTFVNETKSGLIKNTYTTADYNSNFTVNGVIAELLTKDPGRYRFDEGVSHTIETIQDWALKNPIMFADVMKHVLIEDKGALDRHFPVDFMEGDKWEADILQFDPQMAELSVLNTVPRKVSSWTEHMEGHLMYRQQAYLLNAKLLDSKQRLGLVQLLLETWKSNLQATWMLSARSSIFNNNNPYQELDKRHAVDGLIGHSVSYALRERAKKFAALNKYQHGILTIYNDIDAMMSQYGGNNYPDAMLTTEETRTWMSSMDRCRLIFEDIGADATNNRRQQMSYIRAKGRLVDILTTGTIDGDVHELKSKQPHLTEVATGAFGRYKNVAKGLQPEEYTTDYSTIEMADCKTNGFKRYPLLEAYKKSGWFLGYEEDFPFHKDWDLKAKDQTFVRIGDLNYYKLGGLAKDVKANGRIDKNTNTNYAGVEWQLDTFLEYNSEYEVDDKMGETEKVARQAQDLWVPLRFIGQIDPRLLPDDHLIFMAKCLEQKGITDYTKWMDETFAVDLSITSGGGGGGVGVGVGSEITVGSNKYQTLDGGKTFSKVTAASGVSFDKDDIRPQSLTISASDAKAVAGQRIPQILLQKLDISKEINRIISEHVATQTSTTAEANFVKKDIIARNDTVTPVSNGTNLEFDLNLPTYTAKSTTTPISTAEYASVKTAYDATSPSSTSSSTSSGVIINNFQEFQRTFKGLKTAKDVNAAFYNNFTQKTLKSRYAKEKTLPARLAEAFHAIIHLPFTLQTLTFLAENDIPFPTLGLLIEDSRTQNMESIAFLAARVIGRQLYGTEGLMKSVTHYPVDDVYKVEGGVRHGTAVLAKEGIAVFDNAIGRGIIGGWGDSYINDTVDGHCISIFDHKAWEDIVLRRVGNGRLQGDFSKVFVPSPLVEPAMDEVDYSSTGWFKKENFVQDLDINNDRLFPRIRKGPMFIGQSYLNYIYGTYKVHQHSRIPAGDTSILIRRKMARYNNIISADSVRRWSAQAKTWVVDKSHTQWGNIGQNVRLYVSSEMALNDGSTQDSSYHNPGEGGTYSY